MSNDLDVFQETLKELFPSWWAVLRHREVIIFAAGQMKDPRPLLQHFYEMQVEHGPCINADLFDSLHTESTVQLFDDPLHNKYINYYEHWNDFKMRRPIDTTPVYYPSRLYEFRSLREEVVLGKYKRPKAEIPECAMYIYQPIEKVTKSLLSKCRKISKRQAVTDLRMVYVIYDNVTAREELIISQNFKSLYVNYCFISPTF